MPAYQLAVGSLNAISRMHGFEVIRLAHFFASLLDQIVARPDHQDSASVFGTGTFVVHGASVTLARPFNAIILGAHVSVLNVTPLRAGFSLRTNGLTLVDIDTKGIGIVRPLVGIRTGGS